ncbi:S1 RNA-binding domain-containing protein [Shewanella sp. cp20]|uniref:S1 RNA-binding domain-containing protein n=1 Tax=Shewanella sp. cp20 TaxID=1521167 RepID=UPI0005A1EDC6|nr:hypothetical protein DB48_02675 [Shewanella sp. cp20]
MTSQDVFKKGNFFKARITRIEPSLKAAFVDFGAERYGFLPLSEIEGFDRKLHKEGSFLTVSIAKPEHGQKGAELIAHKEAPRGVIVHELFSSETGNKVRSAAFYILVVCVIGALVYLNT